MKPSLRLVLIFCCLVSLVWADDWTRITGQVSKVRQGQTATFYTVTAESGTEYVANSATSQVRLNEAIFKQAYAKKKPLYIEFQSSEKFPNSIWIILKIELIDNGAAKPTAGPPTTTKFIPEPNDADLVASVPPPMFLPGKIAFARMFADGMILQREMPIPIWGWAPAGVEVTIEFAGQKKSATADTTGRWQVSLDPLKVSYEPRELSLKTATVKIKLSNILVGEVWILSGQSNMEWWLESSDGGKEAVQAANYPWLRYFTPGFQLPEKPARDVSAKAGWQLCSPEKVGQFSAVGFWMAQRLHEKLDVPIGLIKNAVSGTYGESWVPLEVLESIPAAQPRLKEYQDALKVLPQENERWKKEKSEWQRKSAEAKKNGTPEPENSLFLRKGPMGPDNNLRPYALYNGLVAPLMPYAVRGVVWYQGEGNSQKHRVGYYSEILEGLVGSWRKGWNQPKLPFLIVQLPRFEPGPNNDWPQLREAQRQAAANLTDTHLVVTIDTGDAKTIHPTNKAPVARRVADLALQDIYGKAAQARAPAPLSAELAEGAVVVRFSDIGDGLTAIDGAPRCFEIAGDDGKFIPAEAKIILPDTVRLNAAAIPKPAKIRYAYASVPDVNLFGGSGIPVVPFSMSVTSPISRTIGYSPDMPKAPGSDLAGAPSTDDLKNNYEKYRPLLTQFPPPLSTTSMPKILSCYSATKDRNHCQLDINGPATVSQDFVSKS